MEDFFEGKKILIIGGTGTIGSKILKALLKENPKVIRVFSRDEHKQFLLQQEIGHYPNIRYLIGDIRDSDRLYRAMREVDYVFHVAAMKHVPFCEYNPFEAVQTNIIGTHNVIQAALQTGVKKVIFTSTDKAIAPTNTYGATKLTAERLIASAQYYNGTKDTVFAAVRFGNVMGSRGSVIPLFKEQITKGRKMTVTDLEMSRFMMTVEQATHLTIDALKRAQGGEIFILKMPIIHLGDLVEVIASEMSNKLHISKNEIKIEEIGLRVGEKMYEELMTKEESVFAYETDSMFILPSPFTEYYPLYGSLAKAKVGEYGSHSEEPLSKEEIRHLLVSSGLL